MLKQLNPVLAYLIPNAFIVSMLSAMFLIA